MNVHIYIYVWLYLYVCINLFHFIYHIPYVIVRKCIILCIYIYIHVSGKSHISWPESHQRQARMLALQDTSTTSGATPPEFGNQMVGSRCLRHLFLCFGVFFIDHTVFLFKWMGLRHPVTVNWALMYCSIDECVASVVYWPLCHRRDIGICFPPWPGIVTLYLLVISFFLTGYEYLVTCIYI